MAPRRARRHAGAKVTARVLADSMKEVLLHARQRCSRKRRRGEQILLSQSGLLARRMLRQLRQRLRNMRQKLREQRQEQCHSPIINALGHQIPVPVLDLFFSNEMTQLRQSMVAYIQSRDPIVQVAIPGDQRMHKKSSDHARNMFNAILDWTTLLVHFGFSVDGNLHPDDLGVTHSGFLKGTKNLLDKLVPADALTTSRDMYAVADVAENNIFCVAVYGPVPADVADLLSVLKNFNNTLYPLLQIHVARENGTRKCTLFTKLFDRLIVIKGKDYRMYTRILRSITLSNWIHSSMKNVHLHELLRFKQPSKSFTDRISDFLSGRVRYLPTVEGLLVFRRNGGAHLIKDYSFDIGGVHEALKAAHQAAAHSVQSIAAALGGVPQPIPARCARELLEPFHIWHAKYIASSIIKALRKHNGSLVEAAAAATAAALARASHPDPTSYAAVTAAGNAARAAARAAIAAAGPVGAQQVSQRQMFDEEQLSDMFDLVDPHMLYKLQRALFNEGELVTLKWHENFTDVRLLR
ncbi:uncharacterized protein [Setaria viridis]|uniref:Uncharacterized protein n=1 Tax=Setaria viridis TaxID=4556 RepID=A0A4U6V378_SETVI|nr:uncharacterized protein LOC117851321 isoform X1 [Setaria viridis]TKW23468.1 hypothetical protein SEVIR_4G293502v2 [Setaria viridis]